MSPYYSVLFFFWKKKIIIKKVRYTYNYIKWNFSSLFFIIFHQKHLLFFHYYNFLSSSSSFFLLSLSLSFLSFSSFFLFFNEKKNPLMLFFSVISFCFPKWTYNNFFMALRVKAKRKREKKARKKWEMSSFKKKGA